MSETRHISIDMAHFAKAKHEFSSFFGPRWPRPLYRGEAVNRESRLSNDERRVLAALSHTLHLFGHLPNNDDEGADRDFVCAIASCKRIIASRLLKRVEPACKARVLFDVKWDGVD